MLYHVIKIQLNSKQMSIDSRNKKIQTFRIAKKFPQQFFRYHSEQKANSHISSSNQSNFSQQYITMRSKYKLMTKNSRQRFCKSYIGNFNKKALKPNRTHINFSQTKLNNDDNKSHTVNVNVIPFFINNEKISRKIRSYTVDIKQQLESNRSLLKLRTNKGKKFTKLYNISNYSDSYQNQDEINPVLKALHKNRKNKKQNNSNYIISIDQISINSGFIPQKQNLLNHVKKVLDIYQQIDNHQHKKNHNIVNLRELQRTIKIYVLEKNHGEIQKCQQIFNSNNNSDNIDSNRKQILSASVVWFREFIACQRILIISMVDLIYHQKIGYLGEECKIILEWIIIIYHQLITKVLQSKTSFNLSVQKKSKQLLRQIKQQQIQIPQNTIRNITQKIIMTINSLFRYSPNLKQIYKNIILQSKTKTINYLFYDILKQYAVHLNQGSQDRLINNFLRTFATCPSPFILKPRKKQKIYTLVIDLDETLIHTQISNGKYMIRYRPYAVNFINNLSMNYQIVIFTSSVATYAQEVLKKFKGIDYSLYRQHTTKTKGQAIKDISRIGRNIETVIIIDNLEQNFKLQPENGIKIKSWYHDKNDSQLQKIEKVLNKLIQQKPKDIRNFLKNLQR